MDRKLIIGWAAVGFSTIISCLWAFWGIFENFHEGWYNESLIQNLELMITYLTLMTIFIALSLAALRWPRVGASLYVLFGILFCIWIFYTRKTVNLSVILSWLPVTLPLVLIGMLYWYGQPKPLSRAYKITILLPLLVLIIFGFEPATRIAGRVDDGNREIRLVEGNGVKLIWAPEGPGWPKPNTSDSTWTADWGGPTWEEAQNICRYLEQDGNSIADSLQNIWRLPTVEEVVRSMTRHGNNCGGVWDSTAAGASYTTKPDKESPLWNPYSPVIYWWTSTEKDGKTAFYIVYNGKVFLRDKNKRMGSQGFRAVKEVIEKQSP